MAVDLNTTVQNGSDAITTICLAVAASANSIALAQMPAAAGLLTLNGALIVSGAYASAGARRLVVASTGNEGATTVTLVGTDRNGNAISEVASGLNVSTYITVQDFLTLASGTINAAAIGNITVGTSAIASGTWIVIDRVSNNPINIAIGCQLVSGAANYTVEECYDDPNGNGVNTGALFPVNVNAATSINVGGDFPPVAFADNVLINKAATAQSTITAPFWAFRLTINSGTGEVKMKSLSAMTNWHR